MLTWSIFFIVYIPCIIIWLIGLGLDGRVQHSLELGHKEDTQLFIGVSTLLAPLSIIIAIVCYILIFSFRFGRYLLYLRQNLIKWISKYRENKKKKVININSFSMGDFCTSPFRNNNQYGLSVLIKDKSYEYGDAEIKQIIEHGLYSVMKQ